MRVRDDEDEEVPELNMAPLIDCIFLLLIFFLLTSSLQQMQDNKPKPVQQLVVDLPEAVAAQTAPAQPGPLVVAVDEAGQFYIDGQRVGIEELHRRLRGAGKVSRRIRIEGDRRAAFESVARVIDLCQFEGLHDVAIRTKDE